MVDFALESGGECPTLGQEQGWGMGDRATARGGAGVLLRPWGLLEAGQLPRSAGCGVRATPHAAAEPQNY